MWRPTSIATKLDWKEGVRLLGLQTDRLNFRGKSGSTPCHIFGRLDWREVLGFGFIPSASPSIVRRALIASTGLGDASTWVASVLAALRARSSKFGQFRRLGFPRCDRDLGSSAPSNRVAPALGLSDGEVPPLRTLVSQSSYSPTVVPCALCETGRRLASHLRSASTRDTLGKVAADVLTMQAVGMGGKVEALHVATDGYNCRSF